jgi:hypothetical protein
VLDAYARGWEMESAHIFAARTIDSVHVQMRVRLAFLCGPVVLVAEPPDAIEPVLIRGFSNAYGLVLDRNELVELKFAAIQLQSQEAVGAAPADRGEMLNASYFEGRKTTLADRQIEQTVKTIDVLSYWAK